MKLMRQLLVLFQTREKLVLFIFLILNVSSSLLELIGIGAVVPFIMLIAKPEFVQKNHYFKLLYNFIAPDSYRNFIIIMALALMFFFLLKNLYMLGVFTFQQTFIKRKHCEMTNALFKSYLFKPYAFFYSHSSAELLRNIQSIVSLTLGLFSPMINLLSEFITILVLSIFLFIVNPIQSLIIGSVMGSLVFFGLRLVKHRTKSLGERRIDVDKHIINNVNQGLGSIKETRILGDEKILISRNEKTVKQFASVLMHVNILSVLPRLYIESLAMVAVLSLMIVMFNTSWETERIIMELSLFGMVAVRLMPSVTRISVSISNIRIALPAFNEVYNDILDALHNDIAISDNYEVKNKLPFNHHIKLNHISFSYDNNKKIIDNVSMDIEKNQCIGIVGPSGSGKTTLVDLLIGLLEPDSGEILIDNLNIKNRMREWQANIGYIPQQIFIFDDTIAANIAIGKTSKEIDFTRIEEVLRMAQLDRLVQRLPEGINTAVGERGIKLSGGERQRLGIARALYRDPDVLVMDEATSALDIETEKLFMKAIDVIAREKTIIIIAHRLTTIEKCDKVFNFNNASPKVV